MQGNCHNGESTCQARVWVLSSEQVPIFKPAISLTPNPLAECIKVRTVSFVFLAAHFLGHLAHFLALP
jgi:hypothetical protein